MVKLQILRARQEYECKRCLDSIKKGERYVRMGRTRLCKRCGLINIKAFLGI